MKRLYTLIYIVAIVLFLQKWGGAQHSEPDQEPKINQKPELEASVPEPEKEKPDIGKMVAGQKSLILVTTSINRGKITVGDKIVYKIEVTAQENIKVEFPEFGEMLAGFSITDYSTHGPVKSGNTLTWSREYVLDVYLTGTYVIPPARITYRLNNGEPKQILTAPLFVTVDTVLSDENAQLKEIKPIKVPELAVSKTVVAGGILGLFLLIASVVGVVVWLKKRGQYVEPPRPAHLIALDALNNLRKQGLVESGQIKEYYFLVSNILRHYIEGRFGLMAPERTTEEFLDELQKATVLNQPQKDILSKFLMHCDMVKFAKYNPSGEQIERVLETAFDFVEQTKPQEVIEKSQEQDVEDEEEEDA